MQEDAEEPDLVTAEPVSTRIVDLINLERAANVRTKWTDDYIDFLHRRGVPPKCFVTAPNFFRDHHGNLRGYKAVFSRDTRITRDLFPSPMQLGIVTAAYAVKTMPENFSPQRARTVLNETIFQTHEDAYDFDRCDTVPWVPTLGGGLNSIQLITHRDAETHEDKWMIFVRASLDHASTQLMQWATNCVLLLGELVHDDRYRRLLDAADRNAARLAVTFAAALDIELETTQKDVESHEDSEYDRLAPAEVFNRTNILREATPSGDVEVYMDTVSLRDSQHGVLILGNPSRTTWYCGEGGTYGKPWTSPENTFPASIGFSLTADFDTIQRREILPNEAKMIQTRMVWEGEVDFNPRSLRFLYRPFDGTWLVDLERAGWHSTWTHQTWETILAKYAADNELEFTVTDLLRYLPADEDVCLRVSIHNKYVFPTLGKHLRAVRENDPNFQWDQIFQDENPEIMIVKRSLLEQLRAYPTYTFSPA